MSCYLRHLRDVFDSLELDYDKLNRARVDAAIRETLGLSAEDPCPRVWTAVKSLSAEDRATLAPRIARMLGD